MFSDKQANLFIRRVNDIFLLFTAFNTKQENWTFARAFSYLKVSYLNAFNSCQSAMSQSINIEQKSNIFLLITGKGFLIRKKMTKGRLQSILGKTMNDDYKKLKKSNVQKGLKVMTLILNLSIFPFQENIRKSKETRRCLTTYWDHPC